MAVVGRAVDQRYSTTAPDGALSSLWRDRNAVPHGPRVDRPRRVDRPVAAPCAPAPVPARAMSLAVLFVVGSVAAGGVPVTASFTDSQNRTLLYRYELADGQDAAVPQGVLLFFHGNNTGTQERIVNSWFPSVKRHAEPLGLVPVALASPYTNRTRHQSVDRAPKVGTRHRGCRDGLGG